MESREETLIFFESPHRLAASLREMLEIFGDREAAVAHEGVGVDVAAAEAAGQDGAAVHEHRWHVQAHHRHHQAWQ